MTSPIFMAAVAQWRGLRAEFELFRESAYAAAEHETKGNLLNARGKKAGIDPYSLFIGNEATALAYASEELIEHWSAHPRVNFEQFERQYTEEPN